MKNLILPQKSDTTIDIGQLTPDFEGLVIGYNNDTPVGYVIYWEDEAQFVNSTYDDGCILERDENLLSLVTQLIDRKVCTHFKVLEFGH